MRKANNGSISAEAASNNKSGESAVPSAPTQPAAAPNRLRSNSSPSTASSHNPASVGSRMARKPSPNSCWTDASSQ